jgi:hypothetical protein
VSSAVVPNSPLGDGYDLTGSLLLNPDGTAATGIASPGSLVVSQLAACRTLTGTMIQVFDGGFCPVGTTPTTAPIYIDGLDGALVNAVTATMPVADPAARGQSDTSLDVFGLAVLRKDWSENFHTALRYERTQGGASGLGGAVIRDWVTLSNTWDFAERWQLALRGEWVLRQSVYDGTSQYLVAGDPGLGALFTGTTPAGATGLVTIQGGNTNQIDTMRYGVAGRMTHRFTRNTSGWLQLTYNRQSSDSNTLGAPSDFDDYLAVLGVRYVFDPIKLW